MLNIPFRPGFIIIATRSQYEVMETGLEWGLVRSGPYSRVPMGGGNEACDCDCDGMEFMHSAEGPHHVTERGSKACTVQVLGTTVQGSAVVVTR
jgi:hypothetical protein